MYVMRFLVSWIGCLLAAGMACADNYPRQPSVDVTHYSLALELGDASDSISATAKIHVRVRGEAASGMRLDFAGMRVSSLKVQGRPQPYALGGDGLKFGFGRTFKRGESLVVEVRYHGKPRHGLGIGRNRYGKRIIFSENWPDRAHYWFPCIDHPSDKATVEVTVTAPDRYTVVSNGSRTLERRLRGKRTRTRWIETKEIPVYCIAIGVAEFSVARGRSAGGVPLEWYSYPEDSPVAERKFAHTAAAVDYFASLIGPYPYEKLAQVQASLRFDGMENASAIFYDESLFRTDAVPLPLPHEIAHQWFGNSVTPDDWDHVWLSEGFATYLEALFEGRLRGPQALRDRMAESAERLARSGLAQTEPVVNPAQTDPLQKLNPLSYEKGAWILHMLRGMMGDASFFRGLRHYYARHAGGAVSGEDFRRAMEASGGISLKGFFDQWLHRPGLPEYEVSWKWDPGARLAEVRVRQTQVSGLYDVTAEIVFETAGRRESHKFRIRDAEHVFRMPLPEQPLNVRLDPGGWLLKTVRDGR